MVVMPAGQGFIGLGMSRRGRRCAASGTARRALKVVHETRRANGGTRAADLNFLSSSSQCRINLMSLLNEY